MARMRPNYREAIVLRFGLGLSVPEIAAQVGISLPAAKKLVLRSTAQIRARMEAIEAELPASDGFACFNRMYLDVTRQVYGELGQNFYTDPAFMTELDVKFANMYFAAFDAADASPALSGLPKRELQGVAVAPGG